MAPPAILRGSNARPPVWFRSWTDLMLHRSESSLVPLPGRGAARIVTAAIAREFARGGTNERGMAPCCADELERDRYLGGGERDNRIGPGMQEPGPARCALL